MTQEQAKQMALRAGLSGLTTPERRFISAMYVWRPPTEPVELAAGWVAVDEADYKLALDRITQLEADLFVALHALSLRERKSETAEGRAMRLEQRVRYQRAEIRRLHDKISELCATEARRTAVLSLRLYEETTSPRNLLLKKLSTKFVESGLVDWFINLGSVVTRPKGRDA